MAYLNIRERRIETKIAYVGPELSGKATNFGHLGKGTVSDDQVLSLDWKPSRATTFRDCDVTVRLIAPRGDPSGDRVRDILREVDGVVFVADADPEALGRNRASMEVVRAALASAARRDLPMVVQLNKIDLPDAMSVDHFVRVLDVSAWPCVAASAARGQGVSETAERALDTVLEALQKGADVEPSTPPPPTLSSPHAEGNPLLDALRQVLRETVAEQTKALEARMNANLERQLASFFERANASFGQSSVAEIAALHLAFADESAWTRRAFAEQAQAMAALGDAFRAANEGARQHADRTRESTLHDLLRALESRARTDREHLASLSTTLTQAIKGITDEANGGWKTSLITLRTAIDGLSARVNGLPALMQPAVSAMRLLTPRLAEVETNLQRDVREGVLEVVAKLDDRLTTIRKESGDAFGRTETRTGDLHALLQEIVEEVRKRKKGWFS